MTTNSGSRSIAEVLAEAEKQKVETAKRVAREYAQRRQAAAQAEAQAANPSAGGNTARTSAGKWSGSTMAVSGGARQQAAAPAAKKTDDLRDEFDYALEAVEIARKSVGTNPAAVEAMAINMLMAKAGVPRDDAPRYIRKAIKYLDS